tara:strand:- start:220 stop:717 length:498 start_codon:yes stop_codon:yes gene_type:complete
VAGRKNTREQVEARKAEVESALASGQWSRQIAAGLAARWAVSQRQIMRDKATVMEAWKRQHGEADHTLEQARIIEEMRGVRARCVQAGLREGNGDPRLVSQAVNLFRLEVEVLGLADPTRVEIGVTTADPAQLALEVLSGLPMLGEMLGLEPRQLIDAAYTQAEE